MPRRRSHPVIALSLVLTCSALRAAPAEAYCRSSTCDGLHGSKLCNPPDLVLPGSCPAPSEEPDCGGVPIAWPRGCTGYAVQKDASRQVSLGDARTVLRQAFDTWEGAACPTGGTPHVHIEDFGTVDCNEHEYNQHGGNVSVILFTDDGWPGANAASTIALTSVTFLNDGEIVDADMLINTANFQFSLDATPGTQDLLAVVTHEAGHFLGLAHTNVGDGTPTMTWQYGCADPVAFRDLADDDIAAICDAYPPRDDPSLARCNPLPKHGFSPECAASQTEGSCAIAASARGRGGAAWWTLAGLLVIGRTMRRRGSSARRVRQLGIVAL